MEFVDELNSKDRKGRWILSFIAFFLAAANLAFAAFFLLLRIMTTERKEPTTAEPRRTRMTGIRIAQTLGDCVNGGVVVCRKCRQAVRSAVTVDHGTQKINCQGINSEEASPKRERSSSRGRSPSPRRSRSPSEGSISPRRGQSPSRDSRSPSPPPRDQSPRDSRDGSRHRSRPYSRDRETLDVSLSPRRDRSFSRDSRDASPPRRNFRDDSPPRNRSPDAPRPRDHSPLPRRPAPAQRSDRYRPAPRERTPPPAPPVKTEEEKLADARAEYQKLLNLRSQGVYLPPQKLRALQAAITDRSSKEYQRMAWEALKKSINGLVNKVNTANIKFVVPELFGENLIRGRGLFCQSLLKAQHASLPFTPIYACLAAICNTKLPQVGELLVKRLIMRFRKAFKRNDKAVCLSSTMFIAHLVNNQVVHEMLAAQILLLLLQRPTDDSVEIAVGLMKEVGLFLEEMSPPIAHAVFDQFRNILHEADIDKRTQYMIEVLFQVRKDKYKDNPVIKEELDLIEEEDQITHRIALDDDISTQDTLNIFKFDPDWEANEEEYKKLKAEILGEGSGDEDDDDDDGSDESESGDEGEQEQKAIEIKDQSNADLVNLRRTIYLSIQSSADPEEAAHKLMKLKLPAGQEPELVSMIVESCAQEKVYLKFMGLLGERFARLNRMWMDLFEEAFVKYYNTIHQYETNKLRNIARFWGHQLANDAIGWHVLSIIHLNEEETTSASRIFIKILFEDLQENMGTAKLKARLAEETLKPSLEGIFPHDNPRNIRFSINYFTSIKMGFLTDEMREFLANMPKPALPAPAADSDAESVSSYSSYSSYSSRSRSRSRTSPRKAIDRGRSYSRSPPRKNRDDSYSRSRSRSRSYSRSVSRRSYSRSPVRNGRDDRSVSRSPVRRSRSYSRSPSRSRSPTPNRARGRSYSRSISPDAGPSIKRRRDDSYSRSRSRSRSVRRSRSPLPVQRRRDDSRRFSRSPSPVRRDVRPRRSSYSRSRSRSPVRAGGGGPGRYRQRDSPPPPPASRGRAAASYSRSRSPPPPVRNRSLSRSRIGGNKRRRGYSSDDDSRSISPPPPRAKRGRVDN
ncbi:putative pre-mRNA-splicing factor cwc-22 [Podospora fimiseda]|uniref:Pre-mRNA-splicing factor CWC22 n=1 Tax=Podospora fimiseda TaxID=252190 RepID=A0AAN7BIX0_9PEZI|nr:putative pre-mRNA-splicing factor cwc-22 [Podospora fimiseda]